MTTSNEQKIIIMVAQAPGGPGLNCRTAGWPLCVIAEAGIYCPLVFLLPSQDRSAGLPEAGWRARHPCLFKERCVKMFKEYYVKEDMQRMLCKESSTKKVV